jgi:hypothetical protein
MCPQTDLCAACPNAGRSCFFDFSLPIPPGIERGGKMEIDASVRVV